MGVGFPLAFQWTRGHLYVCLSYCSPRRIYRGHRRRNKTAETKSSGFKRMIKSPEGRRNVFTFRYSAFPSAVSHLVFQQSPRADELTLSFSLLTFFLLLLGFSCLFPHSHLILLKDRKSAFETTCSKLF